MKKNALIFLVGFMGAGKTTVGRALARHLDVAFFDLDEMIQQQTGKSITQIFSESGEVEFRRLETIAIRSCRDHTNAVIALGGGTYVSELNRDVLREMGKTIWLNCPVELCLARIEGDQSRPLLSDQQKMKSLFESRLPTYILADFAVKTESRSTEEIASEIIKLISEQEE
jgi:shikimate kinase